MTTRYRPPRLLDPGDRLDGFTCRSGEQTTWLRRHARDAATTGTTRVFVVTAAGRPHVIAYYAWRMAQLDMDPAPAGAYPWPVQPVAFLARLAVDTGHEGLGLGAALLTDAITRLLTLNDAVGCRGLIIHAETGGARDFYRHLVPELTASPTDPLHLALLTRDARRTLAR